MTIPVERTRAVLGTKRFLESLLDPKKTPRTPKEVRRHAALLLRHYPKAYDLEACQLGWNSSLSEGPFGELE